MISLLCWPFIKSNLKKLAEEAKKGNVQRTWFPGAKERNYRNEVYFLFYDRQAGPLDVFDVREKLKEKDYSIEIFSHKISSNIAADFKKAGAKVKLIERNPSYMDAWKILSDGLGLVAVVENPTYGKVFDLKQAERDSNKKYGVEKSGQIIVYGVSDRLGLGKIDDVVAAKGFPVEVRKKTSGNFTMSRGKSLVIDRDYHSPTDPMYYGLKATGWIY